MSREPAFQRDMSAPVEERRFEVGAPDGGRRLDAFLAERMSWRSRTRIQELITASRVSIDSVKGREASPNGALRSSTRVRTGDTIVARLDAAHVEAGAREEASIEVVVVYEDDHLLAVSKPPHMNVYPSRRHLGGSLIERVHRRHRVLGLGGAPPSPCHRLDRETSGLVLFAKDRETRAAIGLQFEARTVEKAYLAVVVGAPGNDEGVIDLPLGRDPSSRVEIKQGPRLDGGGLPARTRWRVRERFEEPQPRRSAAAGFGPVRAAGRALLEIHPETGRQHQIRAHLAAIGHPIVGDKLYLGGDALFLASLERPLTPAELPALGGLDRQALHAWRLTIVHPATGDRLTLEVAPPRDLPRER